MELARSGLNGTRQRPHYISCSKIRGRPMIEAIYYGVGNGVQRRSKFTVRVTWSDVTGHIRMLARAGHPGAIQIRKAMSLATAAEKAGWRRDRLQSN